MTEEEQIYICAVRYGLGRQTYITGVISDFMQKKTLSNHCKSAMIRDIERERDENNLGHDCDKKAWLDLLAYLKK